MIIDSSSTYLNKTCKQSDQNMFVNRKQLHVRISIATVKFEYSSPIYLFLFSFLNSVYFCF